MTDTMDQFDALPEPVRKLVHEYGYKRVLSLHRRGLGAGDIERVLSENRATLPVWPDVRVTDTSPQGTDYRRAEHVVESMRDGKHVEFWGVGNSFETTRQAQSA